jgi:hypothetical protein
VRIEGVAWSLQRIPTAVNLGFLDPEPLLFRSSSSSVIFTRLSGPRSRPTTSQNIFDVAGDNVYGQTMPYLVGSYSLIHCLKFFYLKIQAVSLKDTEQCQSITSPGARFDSSLSFRLFYRCKLACKEIMFILQTSEQIAFSVYKINNCDLQQLLHN